MFILFRETKKWAEVIVVSKCLRTPPTDGCYLIDLCWRPQGTTEPLKHNPGTTVITSSPLSPPRSASSRELEGFCCLLPNEPEHYNVVESTLLLRFLLLDYVDHMQGQHWIGSLRIPNTFPGIYHNITCRVIDWVPYLSSQSKPLNLNHSMQDFQHQ